MLDLFSVQLRVFLKKKTFARMDGCSTMFGGHNGVRKYFKELFSHNLYLHCRNQQLALFFCHLIPKYDKLKQLVGLLLNIWLILKNSLIRQFIFDEVQKPYELTSLKLVKAAFTCWFSHGCSAERVLDHQEPLVAALDTIFFTKKGASCARVERRSREK